MIKLLSKSVLVLGTTLILIACGGSSSSAEPEAPAKVPETNIDPQNADSLVRTFSIQNETCPNGGVEIETGIDSNRNGLLDTDEVDPSRIQTVCHGADGSDGTDGSSNLENLLIDIIDEPFGENCLHGGDVHRIGLDESEDGILQESEIISVSFTCNVNGAPEVDFISIQENQIVIGTEFLLLVNSVDKNNSVYGDDEVELTITSKPSWLNISNTNANQIFLKGFADGNVGDTYTIAASSTDGEKTTEKEFVVTIIEGTSVIFSAINGDLPIANDLLFSSALQTDGTANVADVNPPISTAINDLAGFSLTASIDLAFSDTLDPATVVAGSSIWLVELKSKEDNSLIDALDLASILSVFPENPFSEGADQLVPGQDYLAEYVEMDNGTTPTIRIHPLKPLDPKTKYIVIVTDKLMGANGELVTSSSEYTHLAGNEDLISPFLAPVRTAIQVWEQLAGGFLAAATGENQTQYNVILSYAFTTDASDDILLSMVAPENYLFNLFADTVGLERVVGEENVAAVISSVAAALNASNEAHPDWIELDPMTNAGRLATRNTTTYKTALANSFAEHLVLAEAGQDTVDAIKGAYPDPADYAVQIQATAANGAGSLLKSAAKSPVAQDFFAIPNVIIPHDNTGLNLPNPHAVSMQGMLTLPQFMKTKSLADATSFSSFWKGSSSVGAVIDAAFGNPAASTPLKDSDDTINVTYRFPFAQYIEDAKVPVLVTYPTVGGGCTKPKNGWMTIIFQHGFTGNRTKSLGFANSMSAETSGCFATVAMDLPTHGLDAFGGARNGVVRRDALFDVFNVTNYIDGANTPFSSTVAVAYPIFDGLAERHNNLALDSSHQPIAMSFEPGKESGNSGDFFVSLSNMQQTRDHLRQTTVDIMNLTASISSMDIDTGGAGDLDEDSIYFAGISLGAITSLTSVAVNNAVANNTAVSVKDVKPFKAAVFASPGGQLSKLFENSLSLSGRIMPDLASEAGLTQGMADLEKYFSIYQASLDSVDPINFTKLLSATDTPVLMFEMVGGGLVDVIDSNKNPEAGKVTGLSGALIAVGEYPADTVVSNNANPPLNNVATGRSYLSGTDPLISLLELVTVTDSIARTENNLMVVSKFKEGTHGTMSSADAITVFSEMIGQAASFFLTGGKGLIVGDAEQLEMPVQ